MPAPAMKDIPAPAATHVQVFTVSSTTRGEKRKFDGLDLRPAKPTRILLDNGADTCCVSEQKFQTEVYKCKPWPCIGVTGTTTIRYRGTLTFKSVNELITRKIRLQNVPVIPGSPHDVIVGQSLLEPEGSETIRIGSTLRIFDADKTTIVTAERSGALYFIIQPHQVCAKLSVIPAAPATKYKRSNRKSRASLATWHQRLGHAGYAKIEQIAKHGLIHGLELSDHKREDCIHCDMGKLTAQPANFFQARKTCTQI
jgi:hypothetical protein